MSEAFGRALSNTRLNRWQILQPPTGTGKTEGTALYCAMLAEANLHVEHKVGIIIACRTKTQCDELANTINMHVGHKVARAYHTGTYETRDKDGDDTKSDTKGNVDNDADDDLDTEDEDKKDNQLTLEERRQTSVLVITHARLKKAWAYDQKGKKDSWSNLLDWDHGRRRMLIVDEAPNELVEHVRITRDELEYVRGLANPLAGKFPNEVQALTYLCEAVSSASASGTNKTLWTGPVGPSKGLPAEYDLYALRIAIRNRHLDRLLLGRNSHVDQRAAATRITEIIRGGQAILSHWAFYERRGAEDRLCTSYLVMPEDLPSVVVLDATAAYSPLWHLMSDRVQLIRPPEATRLYDNVSLHVCRARGVGKGKMVELGSERLSRLKENYQRRAREGDKALLVLHKDLEAKAKQVGATDVQHWGNLDGRNDWSEYQTIILFGLQYMDSGWAKGMVGALKGVRSLDTEDMTQLETELQIGQLTVLIIQAMNRVRCRRTMDQHGRCLPTDAYIVLPEGDHGQLILANLKEAMPGLVVRPWELELDTASELIRAGSSHEDLLAYMREAPLGDYLLSELQNTLELPPLRTIQKTLRDISHPLTRSLSELGVLYHSGKGRYARSLLRKDAQPNMLIK